MTKSKADYEFYIEADRITLRMYPAAAVLHASYLLLGLFFVGRNAST